MPLWQKKKISSRLALSCKHTGAKAEADEGVHLSCLMCNLWGAWYDLGLHQLASPGFNSMMWQKKKKKKRS